MGMRIVLTLLVVLLVGAGASAQSTDDKVAQADRVWIACQSYSAVNAYFGRTSIWIRSFAPMSLRL